MAILIASSYEADRARAKLQPEAEEQLVRWIEGMADRDQPLKNKDIQEMGEVLYRAQLRGTVTSPSSHRALCQYMGATYISTCHNRQLSHLRAVSH